MPAWTGAGAVTSSCFAVHVRPALWPRAGRSSTMTPSAARCRGPGGYRAHAAAQTSTGCSRQARLRGRDGGGRGRPRAPGRLPARSAEHLRGRVRERAHLRVAVRRLPNRVAVDPERDVVEEEAAVRLGHVDAAFDAVGEGAERADEIVAIDAGVEREVVAGAGQERRRTGARARERLRPRRRATRRRRRSRARPRPPPRPGGRAPGACRPDAGRSPRSRALAPARRGGRVPPSRRPTSGSRRARVAVADPRPPRCRASSGAEEPERAARLFGGWLVTEHEGVHERRTAEVMAARA